MISHQLVVADLFANDILLVNNTNADLDSKIWRNMGNQIWKKNGNPDKTIFLVFGEKMIDKRDQSNNLDINFW